MDPRICSDLVHQGTLSSSRLSMAMTWRVSAMTFLVKILFIFQFFPLLSVMSFFDEARETENCCACCEDYYWTGREAWIIRHWRGCWTYVTFWLSWVVLSGRMPVHIWVTSLQHSHNFSLYTCGIFLSHMHTSIRGAVVLENWEGNVNNNPAQVRPYTL